VHRRVTFDVSDVRISTQLDQRLNIFDQKLDTSKMKGCGALVIYLCDVNLLNPFEQKYGRDSVISLRSAVMYCLSRICGLICICGVMINQTVNELMITSGSS
jgi:hypothetical protein